MYDFRAIFDKEPVVIAGTLRSLLFVAVLAGLLVMDEKLLASIALGAELLLGLFAYKASTPSATADEQVAQAYAEGLAAGQGDAAAIG